MKAFAKIAKTFSVILFILVVNNLYSTEKNDTTSFKITFKGFIRSDIIFDSRQVVSAREGFVLLYPLKQVYDANGKDINEGFNLNQYAASSRLIVTADQQISHDFKIKMYLESDFTGSSNSTYNNLRLRHAYVRLDKNKYFLLVGQYWHPLVAEDVFPDMLSLNLGNPFKSAIRVPQMRFGVANYKNFDFYFTASTQLDNPSIGPDGVSTKYMRDAAMPNLTANIQKSFKNFKIGALVDYKTLLFSKVDSVLGMQKTNLSSMAYSVYGKYESPKFLFKTQFIYGENMFDHVMLGGLAQAEQGYCFQPSQSASAWINVFWKTPKLNIGFFAGYIENLGFETATNGNFFARGSDIHSIYRIAPQFTFKASSRLLFFSETELTTANYGIPDARGRISGFKAVSNLRENISVVFLF